MNTIQELIKKYNPCQEARAWLGTCSSLQTAWNTCERGDWLWWIARKHKLYTKETCVLFAQDCAKRAGKYANAAARADDDAAYAYAYAAAAAVYAYASNAANADDADDAAAYAAAAANANANAAAAAAKWYMERKLQADYIKTIINSFPPAPAPAPALAK